MSILYGLRHYIRTYVFMLKIHAQNRKKTEKLQKQFMFNDKRNHVLRTHTQIASLANWT